jgi:pimeloyl-ACP methyl ester carboxylesterase
MLMVSGPAMIKILRAVGNFRGMNVEEIRVPVLILNGEHESPIVLRHAGMIEQFMPDVRARIIPGASHLSNLDNPEDFDRAIIRLLEIAR